jgi:hypothetical protein
MSVPRSGETATLLDDGRALVAGGIGLVNQSSAEFYDPARNAWTSAGAMSMVRSGARGIKLPDGRVLVAGGYGTTDFCLKTTDIWAPTTTVNVTGGDAGRQNVGTTGAAVAVTVTNMGASHLLIGPPVLGGAQAAEFKLTGDNCSSAPVKPGASCRFLVQLTPTGLGARTAELGFDADTSPVRQVVSLTGQGVTPAAATPSPTPEPTAEAAPDPEPAASATPVPRALSVRVAVPFKSSFTPPPGYSKAKACRGKVTLQLRAGSKVIASRTARLSRRCRYSAAFEIARAAAGGRTVLSVVARFAGNRVPAPTRATYQVRVPDR